MGKGEILRLKSLQVFVSIALLSLLDRSSFLRKERQIEHVHSDDIRSSREGMRGAEHISLHPRSQKKGRSQNFHRHGPFDPQLARCDIIRPHQPSQQCERSVGEQRICRVE